MLGRCDSLLLDSMRRVRDAVSWVVLAACLAITLIAWERQKAVEAERSQTAFDLRAEVLGNALQERLIRYEGLVSAARAALPDAGAAGEEAMARFVAVEDLARRYPGMGGFGMAVPVPAADMAGFTATRRAAQPDFRIAPPAQDDAVPPESPAYVVIQAHPAAVAGVVGYDLATNPFRRETAERARDSGQVVLSPRLTLLTPGASGNDVLIMAPIYRGGVSPATVEERRAALSGWVVAAVRMAVLADSLLTGQQGIDMTVTDVTDGAPGTVVYERRGVVGDNGGALFTRTMALSMGGRAWEVRFAGLPGDGEPDAQSVSDLILLGGIGLSFLLWASLTLLAAGRRMAVAEARRTADALSRSEAKYRRFIASTAEGYVELDGDGRILDVNGALCRILGHPRDALMGRPFLELASSSSRAMIARHLTIRAEGDQWCYDAALRGEKGERRHLRINATTAIDPASGRLHSFALLTDVTAETRLQDQMRSTQARLKQIFVAAPIAMAVVRLEDGVVVQANRSAADLFGLCGDGMGDGAETGGGRSLCGHNFLPYIADPDDGRALLAGVRTTGSVRGFEVRMMRPDGSVWWAMLSAARFLHDGGLAMLVGCQNIDAVKKGREAQKLAAAILESVRDGVMVLSLDRRIQQVNPAFTGITGFPEEEAVGQTPGILESGHRDGPLYGEVWEGVERDGFWSGDLWLRRRSGEAFVSSTSITTIRAGGGAPTHYVAVMHDITARKEDEDRNWRLANYDALTGLPNRLLFADRLSQAVGHAQRSGGRFALLYLDLDGFKPVNDRWGHGAGDQVLRETARRLLGCVRASDTVARVGGDEFVVILADAQDRAAARLVAEKIVEALAHPIALTVPDGRVDGAVTASVGMAVYAADGNSPEAIVEAADAAMYHAKAMGKNRCTFPPVVEVGMG